jgi:hypothetical protein
LPAITSLKRLQLEEFLVQMAHGHRLAAGRKLDQRLGELGAALGLGGAHEAHAGEPREIGRACEPLRAMPAVEKRLDATERP